MGSGAGPHVAALLRSPTFEQLGGRAHGPIDRAELWVVVDADHGHCHRTQAVDQRRGPVSATVACCATVERAAAWRTGSNRARRWSGSTLKYLKNGVPGPRRCRCSRRSAAWSFAPAPQHVGVGQGGRRVERQPVRHGLGVAHDARRRLVVRQRIAHRGQRQRDRPGGRSAPSTACPYSGRSRSRRVRRVRRREVGVERDGHRRGHHQHRLVRRRANSAIRSSRSIAFWLKRAFCSASSRRAGADLPRLHPL